MKPNSLVLIYGDETEDFIKKVEKTFPGARAKMTDLGAPDEAVFYRNLFELLQVKENYRYFGNIKLVLNDERMKIWKPIVERAHSDLGRAFGSYDDTLMGIENMFKNLKYVVNTPDLSDIKVKAGAAIMVMAGPSFETAVETLKKVQDKYLLVAADAILNRCHEEGIYPDIVATSERIPLTSDFFRPLDSEASKKTLLMANVVCWPETFELYQGPIATFYRASTESHWIRRKGKNKEPLVWAPATVSSVALGILGVLGVKKVILVGQDLCHHPKTGQSHADLRIEKFKDWSETKLDLKPLSYKAKPNDPKYKEVWTNARWFAFGTELYRIATVYKQDLINTSELGIEIPGIKYESLDQALTKFPSESKSIEYPDSNPFRKKDLNRLKTKVGKALGELTKIKIGSLNDNGIGYFKKFFNFGYLGLSLMLRPFVHYESKKYAEPWKEPSLRPEYESWLNKTRTDLIRVLKAAQDLLNNLHRD